MTLGYKKWFSILGLLAAILISLFIGLTFDLSILEGMAPGQEEISPGEEEMSPEEEEMSPEEEEMSPEEEEMSPGEEEEVPLGESDMAPALEKKRGESVYNNVMNTPAEAFSLIQNF